MKRKVICAIVMTAFMIFGCSCLSIADENKPVAKAPAQAEQKTSEAAAKGKPAEDPAKAKPELSAERIKAIREHAAERPLEMEFRGTERSVQVHSYLYSGGGLSITIVWRDARKAIIAWIGKIYNIDMIDENGDGKVEKVIFSFKDTSDRDNKPSITRSFRSPFPEPMAERIEQMFVRAVSYIADGSKEPSGHLVNQFNLQELYEQCIKSSVLEKLK